MSRLRTIVLTAIVASLLRTPPTSAEEHRSARWNLATPTFGGQQVWTDEIVFREWRVQRNSLTGCYRLVDPDDWRRAWGDLDQCREALEREKRERELPPLKPRVVILLHGLSRTRDSLSAMKRRLAEGGDWDLASVSYASTRGTVDEHAQALSRVITNLEGVADVDFVAHSMGNIVIRRYLAAYAEEDHPRVGRIVMLAPPNHGSAFAKAMGDDPLFRTFCGESGQELGRGWTELEKTLAAPNDFAVIAGSVPGNGLLDGDDDLVVRVEETRLTGAADFAVVPAPHTTIMNDEAVLEMTLRYLRHGALRADKSPQPIR